MIPLASASRSDIALPGTLASLSPEYSPFGRGRDLAVAIYVGSLACYVAAVGAAFAVLVPRGALPLSIPRERVSNAVRLAAALLVFGPLLTAVPRGGRRRPAGRPDPWDVFTRQIDPSTP